MENILLASLLLNVAGIASRPIICSLGVVGAAVFGFQAFMANAKIKKFDNKQAKFVQTKFVDILSSSDSPEKSPNNYDDDSNKSSTAPFLPSNLEHSIEFHIPIGFRRLRRAMLSHDSEFWLTDILQNTFRYKK